jgi:hypothetical protein
MDRMECLFMFVKSDEIRLHMRGILNLTIGRRQYDRFFSGVTPRGSQPAARGCSDDAGESVPGLQSVLRVHE